MVQLLVLGLNVRFFQVLTLGLALTQVCVICKGHIALSVPNKETANKTQTQKHSPQRFTQQKIATDFLERAIRDGVRASSSFSPVAIWQPYNRSTIKLWTIGNPCR
jgi:hypothetical protein